MIAGLARAVRTAAGSTVGRHALAAGWRARLLVPAGRETLPYQALSVARALADAGADGAAAEVLRLTQDHHGPASPAGRLVAVEQDLMAGIVPAGWRAVVSDLLRRADGAWAAGRDDACAWHLTEALTVLFHPTVCFGARERVVEEPEVVTSLVRSSAVLRAMSQAAPAPAPGPASGPSAPPGGEEPRRILVVSRGNLTFVRGIVEEYRSAGREVRVLDLTAPGRDPSGIFAVVRGRLDRLRGGPGLPAPARAAELLAWAETVFVEWGVGALGWVSVVDRPRRHTVVRIHSYELSTAFPHVSDWSTVDDVVFVAPPMRAMGEAVVAALAPGGGGPRVHVVPNKNGAEAFALPKVDGADRTIALVGWASERKDVAWALDVLEILRRADPPWRLLLVGAAPSPPAAGSDYFRAALGRIEELGDAVVRTGQTDDVPGALRGAGVILSSSRREGTHEALIEGAASGALPVVRDWPSVERWGGPGSVYPAAWIVRTPHEAAARIVAWAGAPDRADVVAATQAWTLANLSWPVVRPRLDAVLAAGPRAGSAQPSPLPAARGDQRRTRRAR